MTCVLYFVSDESHDSTSHRFAKWAREKGFGVALFSVATAVPLGKIFASLRPSGKEWMLEQRCLVGACYCYVQNSWFGIRSYHNLVLVVFRLVAKITNYF